MYYLNANEMVLLINKAQKTNWIAKDGNVRECERDGKVKKETNDVIIEWKISDVWVASVREAGNATSCEQSCYFIPCVHISLDSTNGRNSMIAI